MKLVIVESPYAGDIEANVAYAKRCVRDALTRGEAPIASHLLFTQDDILNDLIPDERLLGREAGLAWTAVADVMAVYTDRGISTGMRQAIDHAERVGLPVEMRQIGGGAA